MNTSRPILNLTLTVLLLVFASFSFAQSSDTSNEADDELVVDKQRIPDAPRSDDRDESKSNGGSSDQVYKPSEEISEDLPVAFPVDI